ncbi:MAG: nmoA [Nocardia sp.]|uniref:bifunctional 3-(3-hydroxy-phenyl)propionate/3-hydroxycinnamic acid hydroxylase n=1 Tax=Nocardia sp. TaxID=1821 RepID=UPI00261A9214|nr:bifunctional 3-(3-hydroxy-phenyl)propionate/3-hydroxycinnamic acid hydroxylase [Nocardia sp.]MCU1639993.1 nmoA [Nocardia sp.]
MNLDLPTPPAARSGQDRLHYDVIIVGCGPTGATLANLLRVKGHRIAVFDRQQTVFDAPRAMLLDDESDRIIRDLGVRDAMVPQDIALFENHRIADKQHKPLLNVHLQDVGVSLGWMFHQPTLETLLREQFIDDPAVHTYFGYDVDHVVTGPETAQVAATDTTTGQSAEFSARYIIGCDGAASTVRRAMGVARTDFGFSQSWVVVDARARDTDYFHSVPSGSEFMCRPDGAAIFAKGCRQHLRFDFQVTPVPGKTDWTADAREHIAEYLELSKIDIVRVSPYTWYASMPQRWRQDRLLLAGDAAHQTPPFAGQGLNMGLRDAVNLAFKLDLVLHGRAPEKLLDTYEQERWKNCATVIKASVATGKLITSNRPINVALRSMVMFAGRHSKYVVRARARMEVRKKPYRQGLIGGRHKTSGSLMISPDVRTPDGVSTLDHVAGNDFLLLATSPPRGPAVDAFSDRLSGRIRVIGRDVDSPEGVLQRWFAKSRASAVLIRPDHYIFDAGNNPDDLCARLLSAIDSHHSTTHGDLRATAR